MIVYSRHCMACRHKELWRTLKRYALQNKLKIEVRRVGMRQQWAEEAASYGMELPFVVIDGEAKEIGGLENDRSI